MQSMRGSKNKVNQKETSCLLILFLGSFIKPKTTNYAFKLIQKRSERKYIVHWTHIFKKTLNIALHELVLLPLERDLD